MKVNTVFGNENIYASGKSIEPASICFISSVGERSLTVQPTEWHVPRISFTVPENKRDMDRGRMTRAISMTWSRVRLPLCLMFCNAGNRG